MRHLSLDVDLDDAQVERLVAAIKGNSGGMYIGLEERDALHAIADALRQTRPMPSVVPHHTGDEAEVGRAAEVIVRRAIAELRGITLGCDCAVMYGTSMMLALALDERVINEDDAGRAIALVDFLARIQGDRRARFGLDERTVDGPLDPRAEAEGEVVGPITVTLYDEGLDVERAVQIIDGTVA